MKTKCVVWKLKLITDGTGMLDQNDTRLLESDIERLQEYGAARVNSMVKVGKRRVYRITYALENEHCLDGNGGDGIQQLKDIGTLAIENAFIRSCTLNQVQLGKVSQRWPEPECECAERSQFKSDGDD